MSHLRILRNGAFQWVAAERNKEIHPPLGLASQGCGPNVSNSLSAFSSAKRELIPPTPILITCFSGFRNQNCDLPSLRVELPIRGSQPDLDPKARRL
jgi:hypothetical protein